MCRQVSIGTCLVELSWMGCPGIDSRFGSGLIPVWLRFASGLVQGWFRFGSGRFGSGLGLVLVWLRFGSGLV